MSTTHGALGPRGGQCSHALGSPKWTRDPHQATQLCLNRVRTSSWGQLGREQLPSRRAVCKSPGPASVSPSVRPSCTIQPPLLLRPVLPASPSLPLQCQPPAASWANSSPLVKSQLGGHLLPGACPDPPASASSPPPLLLMALASGPTVCLRAAACLSLPSPEPGTGCIFAE